MIFVGFIYYSFCIYFNKNNFMVKSRYIRIFEINL